MGGGSDMGGGPIWEGGSHLAGRSWKGGRTWLQSIYVPLGIFNLEPRAILHLKEEAQEHSKHL